MLYLSYGMRKSGSTLAFELTRSLLLHLGHAQERLDGIIAERFRVNFLNSGPHVDEMLSELDRAVPDDTIVVIKTHAAPTNLTRSLADQGRLMGHAVFRDPRDTVLALLDAGAHARRKGKGAFKDIADMNAAIRACEEGMEAYERWCDVPGMFKTSYEEVAFRSDGFLRRVLRQLTHDEGGVPLSNLSEGVKSSRFTQYNRGVPRRHRTDLSFSGRVALTSRFADAMDRHMRDMLDPIDRVLLPVARSFVTPKHLTELYEGRPRPGRRVNVAAEVGPIRQSLMRSIFPPWSKGRSPKNDGRS